MTDFCCVYNTLSFKNHPYWKRGYGKVMSPHSKVTGSPPEAFLRGVCFLCVCVASLPLLQLPPAVQTRAHEANWQLNCVQACVWVFFWQWYIQDVIPSSHNLTVHLGLVLCFVSLASYFTAALHQSCPALSEQNDTTDKKILDWSSKT